MPLRLPTRSSLKLVCFIMVETCCPPSIFRDPCQWTKYDECCEQSVRLNPTGKHCDDPDPTLLLEAIFSIWSVTEG